jgi:glycolate oxidase
LSPGASSALTILVDPRDTAEVNRAHDAARRLYSLTVQYGGSISGEHGLGLVKGGHLGVQCTPAALALHRSVKSSFDPKGLMNPGKKL